ncbi:MAG: NlpC/P60 family protein [Desulfofustis sp.]|jgi:cell wall-associated NlpC family hydrolase|nr:NlpC/P60 family protein [Desulfofustis sp.]
MTPNATINVSVSSHYRNGSYDSETVTQGILGERVEILEHAPLFSKIRQHDGYVSWIGTDQLATGDSPDGPTVLVRSHFICIRAEPSPRSEVIRDAVIGSRLCADDQRHGWTRILLPDGQPGWVETDRFGSFDAATPERIIGLAAEFLGYQYLWGGRTPKGFDCSGLVQTVFALHGIPLPRDSWQQQKQHQLSRNFSDARRGDLLFFGKTPGTVTHVAISLGSGRFIHASGWVRYNSFNISDPDFSGNLAATFISVNRYPSGT